MSPLSLQRDETRACVGALGGSPGDATAFGKRKTGFDAALMLKWSIEANVFNFLAARAAGSAGVRWSLTGKAICKMRRSASSSNHSGCIIIENAW